MSHGETRGNELNPPVEPRRENRRLWFCLRSVDASRQVPPTPMRGSAGGQYEPPALRCARAFVQQMSAQSVVQQRDLFLESGLAPEDLPIAAWTRFELAAKHVQHHCACECPDDSTSIGSQCHRIRPAEGRMLQHREEGSASGTCKDERRTYSRALLRPCHAHPHRDRSRSRCLTPCQPAPVAV